MHTTLSTATSSLTIGFGLPFVVIGERINPTGRSGLAGDMTSGDFTRVRIEAREQVSAGAQVLDLNVGVPGHDEASLIVSAIRAVSEVVDVPLCVDSSNRSAIQHALQAYAGKALINSTTGEERMLDQLLPLAKEHNAAIVAICTDERGPLQDPGARLDIAHRIVERCAEYGIPACDVLLDPMVMAAATDPLAAGVTLETLRRIRVELGMNTVAGASNVSFGIPDRGPLNAAFLSMAMAMGLNAALLNPMDLTVRKAILASDVLLGTDPYAAAWIRNFRAHSG